MTLESKAHSTLEVERVFKIINKAECLSFQVDQQYNDHIKEDVRG